MEYVEKKEVEHTNQTRMRIKNGTLNKGTGLPFEIQVYAVVNFNMQDRKWRQQFER